MRHPVELRILCAIGLLVGSLALCGCPKRPEVGQAPPSAPGPGAGAGVAAAPAAPSPSTASPEVRVEPPAAQAVVPEAPKAPEPAAAAAAAAASPLKDAFFEYDKSALREDQQGALTEDVAWLKGNAEVKVLIEGHCDERGTAEYNLGLGERRAKAVKDYLIAAGIAADRISIISYGKERPFVLGHDESAWQWNRRGHVILQGR